MTSKPKIEVSSGNIFADLRLPNARKHFLKAQIVAEIYRLVAERKLSRAKASKLLGISQPEMSRLFKGGFLERSVEWLKAAERRTLRTVDAPQVVIDAVRNAKMAAKHKKLDSLLRA